MRIARVALPVLLAAFACDHPTPPEPGSYWPQGPFSTAIPRRLTFNPGQDLTPAWLPDGSGIIYQFQRLDEPDFDRCLGILPAAGGVRREICNTNPKSADSTDVYGSPAVSAGGRLFYTRASDFWRLHNLAPTYQSVVVAPLATPLLVDSVRNLPYAVTPGGTMHYGIDNVRWLGDSAVMYVAEFVIYGTCARCRDTFHTGTALDPPRARVAGGGVPGARGSALRGAAVPRRSLGDRRPVRCAVGIVLALAGAVPVAAQSTGAIAGRVRDSTGAPLPFARITVGNGRQGAETDSLGNYRIREVQAGWHRVTVRRVGFQAVSRDSVLVQAGQPTDANLPLPSPLRLQPVVLETSTDTLLDPLAPADAQRIGSAQIPPLPPPPTHK